MRKYLLLICVVYATLSVHSQDNQSAQDKQLAAIKEVINNTYSEKMEKILKADLPRYNQMKKELEAVDNIKDFQSKKKSADDYSKAHKDYYQDAMKKGAISIDALIANLKTQFPDYSFSSPDGISILAERRIAPITPLVGTGKEDKKVAVVTTTTQQLSFTQQRAMDCALAAGGNVSIGTNSINVYSTAAVAGGCSSLGALENNTIVPTSTSLQSISIRLNFNVHISAFAGAILGTSTAGSGARITGGFDFFASDVFSDGPPFRGVFAPVFWYASFDESESYTRTIDLTTFRGRTFQIRARASTLAMSALCCGTTSSSSLNITTAEVETTTRTE